jgi:hypothetical protein
LSTAKQSDKGVKTMKKYVMFAMILGLMLIPCAMAGTGNLNIDPRWPAMVESPANFTIWVGGGSAVACNVQVLLVMTEDCYNGLPLSPDVAVEVSWPGDSIEFIQTDFSGVTGAGGVNIPDSGTTNGANYNAANLKSHLSEGLSTPLEAEDWIYWDMKPILGGSELTGDAVEITVDLKSSNPRMLVYLLAKSTQSSTLYDMKVPPTNPGFLVPEVAPLLLAGSSFGGLALYIFKRKKTSPIQ